MRQVVTLAGPDVSSPDGDGGFVQTFTPLNPAVWRCKIDAGRPGKSEEVREGTITGHATYTMTGRFHTGITNQTRMVWTDRAGVVHTGNVLDVIDVEGAGVQTMARVTEVVP
jgi:hypothetical protein